MRIKDEVVIEALIELLEDKQNLGTAYNAIASGHFERFALGAQGSYLVPPEYLALYGKLRQQKAVFTAGPGIITVYTKSNEVYVPAEASVIDMEVIAENNLIGSQDIVLEQKSQTLTKIMRIVKASEELMQDSNMANVLLSSQFADAVSSRLDQLGLTGSGTGQPLGLLNTSGLIEVSAGADGTSFSDTSALDYLDEAIYQALETAKVTPAGWLMSPRTARSLLKMKSSTGKPIFKSLADIKGYPAMVTSHMPVNETQGVNNDTSSIVLVPEEISSLVIEREGLGIQDIHRGEIYQRWVKGYAEVFYITLMPGNYVRVKGVRL